MTRFVSKFVRRMSYGKSGPEMNVRFYLDEKMFGW